MRLGKAYALPKTYPTLNNLLYLSSIPMVKADYLRGRLFGAE